MSAMRTMILLVLACCLGSGSALADATEPPRGSQLRQDLLEAIRPHAEYDLWAPVEFRVIEMLADGDVAFARLMAQRPGGVEIDMARTAMVEWRYEDPGNFDGPRFEVFFIRRDGQWQVVQYALGATDAWWFGNRCDVFGSLLRQYGC